MFENYKEIKEFKKELKKQYLQKKYLLKKECDWGLIEELVQKANSNPSLAVTVKLSDGTVIEMKTTKDQKKINPLFTDAVFEE